MKLVRIGRVQVSRLCIGGNPFSGFSHQGEERSREMVSYYTPERIRDTLRKAEEAGINTLFARTDEHIFGIIRTYREEGGTIQWFAQVNTPAEDPDSWRRLLEEAAALGAAGAYMHGGAVDFWFAGKRFGLFREAVDRMRRCGLKAVGMAGHNPRAHAWIRDNLEVDFQMCSYYNPTDRSADPRHQAVGEKWRDEDREEMLMLIASIPRPVVHYKVLAAGNKPIEESFERLGRTVRENDVVCIGMYLGDDPGMIRKNVMLIERHVEKGGTAAEGVAPCGDRER